MKLSKILNDYRNGSYIRKLAVKNAVNIIYGAEEYSYNITILQQSYREGDEIVMCNGKQRNVSALKRILSSHPNEEWSIWIGNNAHDCNIEIDC